MSDRPPPITPHPSGQSVPPRFLAMAGWVLLPLRAFLGITFLFAGCQKLANPNFFDAASPSSIQAQLIAANRISPLHPLLGHLLRFATPIGVLIALGEIAVGLGILLGLWSRLAAIGGFLLSLTLFLTVSYHSSPYYTGADIVFVFAWLPFIVGGTGGVLSLDAAIARRAAREAGRPAPDLVVLPFAEVQRLCGHYDEARCRARAGAPCAVAPCPVLRGGDRAATDAPGTPDGRSVNRRTVVLGGAAAAGVAAIGVVSAGLAAGVGRLVGGAKAPASAATLAPPVATSTTTVPTTTPTTGAPGTSTTPPTTTPPTTTAPAGTAIGRATSVPVGSSATFTAPGSGDPALLLHPSSGSFVAFDAVCPHAGCTVGYAAGADLIVCPCHGSEFNPRTGAVVQGPATRGLTPLTVAEGSDGTLYAR